jgi:hypothetical protein
LADQDDIKRATAIINTALRHSMYPAGAMPEDDIDKLTEAETLVRLCQQSYSMAQAIGPARVKNYQAIVDVLYEAEVLVGANGDGAVDPAQPTPEEAQPSPPTPSPQPSLLPVPPAASSPQAPTGSGSETLGRVLTPSPASSASSSSLPSPSTAEAGAVDARPVDADGILAEAKVNEVWSAPNGGQWLVTKDLGGLQLEVISQATGETTVVPAGFLKERVTEGVVHVWVAPGWADEAAPDYNTLYFRHPGCTAWMVPLDDVALPNIGDMIECNKCIMQLPVGSVEANGYVSPHQPTVPIVEAEPEREPIVPPAVTQPYITLTAHPDRGVKVYEHPGCSSWEAPLDGQPLFPVGVQGACARCGTLLTLKTVEPNGYDPATYKTRAQVDLMTALEKSLAPVQPQPSLEASSSSASPSSAPASASPAEPSTATSPSKEASTTPIPSRVPSSTASSTAPAQPPSPWSSTASSAGGEQSGAPLQPQPASSPASSPSPPSPSSDPAPTSAVSATGSSPSASQGSSSTGSADDTTGAGLVDHDEGDPVYAKILDVAWADFEPLGMPAPQELVSDPPAMPEDLTQNPEHNRVLHSQFNALGARARYLAKIEERISRDCRRAARLRLRPYLSKAKKELGASSTLTERREYAEGLAGDDVQTWLERMQRHADRAEAYGELFHIYKENVAVLSRDLTWAQDEERGS